MPLDPRYGIEGQQAPEWDVAQWFNVPDDKPSLSLRDVADKITYLYCFQSWCPGCHSHGFPTLLAVRDSLKDDPGVAFVAIQTVFEGFDVNTLERAKDVARQYALEIPFGHDPGPDGRRSLVMQRYHTGGTPWTVLIDQRGRVRFNDFHAEAEEMTHLIRQMHEAVI